MNDQYQRNNSLIYYWNDLDHKGKNNRCYLKKEKKLELHDETLRDGLQSPSVKTPEINEKIKMLAYMNNLGIDSACIGFPAASEKIKSDVYQLAKEVINGQLNIKISCIARAIIPDIQPIVEISQKLGMPIDTDIFIGSSKIRSHVENWDLDKMLKQTEESIIYAVHNGLSVMFVTEDTTRAEPEVLEKLYKTAIECGAIRICLCDTVGYATPNGVINLITFANEIISRTGENIAIDWHGHNDRGLALSNAIIAAIEGKVDRVHGTCLGIGERSGNTSIDQILINLFLNDNLNVDLSLLGEYCHYISTVCDIPIPCNYPVVGNDAFRTSTGIHAAAVIKAMSNKSSQWLVDFVYSAVPASLIGLDQKIEIGPVSGKSNVIYWLNKKDIQPNAKLISAILNEAKKINHVLKDEEIRAIIDKTR